MTIPFSDARTATSVLAAIQPERVPGASLRTKVALSRRGRRVHLEIDSRDVVGVRAAVNSYMRWFILATRLAELSGDDGDGE